MQFLLRTTKAINGNYNIVKACCHRYSSIRTSERTLREIKHDFRFPLYNIKLQVPQQCDLGLRSIQIRSFSLSTIKYDKEPLKPSSKVEETVHALKEKEKAALAGPLPKAVTKKPMKQRIVDEIVHYYHGFRLLFIDMRISCGLLWRVLNGHTLTRREYRLLMRTVGDMFRLVPFSVFIIVPFMELLLPVFIKFFPGMLPSTFQTATEKEDKLKQNLKLKLEMAKFLQQTLDDMSVEHKDHKSQSAKEFSEWFHKVRNSGEKVSNEEILKFSKVFKDEITLDSLSRSQLVALCRVLEVQTLGTNNLLRFQLRMKLRSLAADDKMIQKEGIDSLSLWEMQQACKARGMRAYGVTQDRLRSQLQDWLDLSLNEKVPPSLLLLSRALMLPDAIPTSDKLKATISTLPEAVITQTKASIGEKEGKIDNKVQLEVIMEEAKRIQEERQEEDIKKQEQKEKLVDQAPIITQDTGIKVEAKDKTEKEIFIAKDLEAIEDAIDTISKEKKVIVEKVEIEELKEQLADYHEDVQDLNKAAATIPKANIRETKAAKRLYNKVNKMIGNMDKLLSELENKEKQLKKEIAIDANIVKKEELLRIDEIMDAIRQIKNVPDDSRLAQIENVLKKIDDDQDGSIKIEDVLKVIEVIGKENVHLSAKQVDELVELLDKEEILEVEDKIEKALKKEQESRQDNNGNVKSKPNEGNNSLKVNPTNPVIPPVTSIDKKNDKTKQL